MIYFIQQAETWAVKIGYTEDYKSLKKRLVSLQTASPYLLTVVFEWEGEPEDEQALHERFARHRLLGEWFRPCPEIAEYIGECKAWQQRYGQIVRGEVTA